MFNFSILPAISLYIHIPWCIHKCAYCDFNSHSIEPPIPAQEYIKALLLDLEQDIPSIQGRTIQNIFIGGGTPSLLSPIAIEQLLLGIYKRIPIRENAEITLEANPGTVDNEYLSGFYQVGINRLSLGIQSFNDLCLQHLDRIHNQIEAIKAIEAAKQAGFNNINLDLMFGLPMQTMDLALNDLKTAINFEPSHLSWYQLTIEPNTLFYHQLPANLPNEDLLYEMQQKGQNFLASSGYKQYEISAYALENNQCQHNLNYWKFGDYLGIGAGAHSKITQTNVIQRFSKPRQPDKYMKYAANHQRLTTKSQLNTKDVILEFMINNLRLAKGFTSQEFKRNTNLDLSIIEKTLQYGYEQGWLEKNVENSMEYIRATKFGMRFLNEVLEIFV
ncbi:MAG: radical SAM family heme chaperone HemW [Thiomargarita sp.]|nr:radical SAM family heme chaperone HemW [Thiomargarita sp.]